MFNTLYLYDIINDIWQRSIINLTIDCKILHPHRVVNNEATEMEHLRNNKDNKN